MTFVSAKTFSLSPSLNKARKFGSRSRPGKTFVIAFGPVPSRRLIRQWGILRYLAVHSSPVSYAALARIFNVSRPLITRDVETLRVSGFSIHKQRSRYDHNAVLVSMAGCCKAAPSCEQLAQPTSTLVVVR